jgi:N-acetylmuramoyl-L-alanine amidase
MKICIDPGHGGSDPGAVNNASGVYEKNITLPIARVVHGILSAYHTSLLTRTDDRYMSLKQRTDYANSQNADLLVSVHCNSVDDPSVYGFELLYYSKASRGLKLAGDIHYRMSGTFDENYTPLHERPGLWILRRSIMPAVIVECGFLSHPVEGALLTNHERQINLAYEIALGILDYIEEME